MRHMTLVPLNPQHADPDVAVLHEDTMTDILDAIGDENGDDTQLLFQRFVSELLAKLRVKLLRGIKNDDIDTKKRSLGLLRKLLRITHDVTS